MNMGSRIGRREFSKIEGSKEKILAAKKAYFSFTYSLAIK
jgi:hypothetical protein